MDAGLNLRAGCVHAQFLQGAHEDIDVFLLRMVRDDRDYEHRIAGEEDDSGRSSETRSGGGGNHGPAGSPVEKNSQRSGQQDAEIGNQDDEDAKQAGLERRTNRDLPKT